jgi:hypothetical protein
VDLTGLNVATIRPVCLSRASWQTVACILPSATLFMVMDGLKSFHQINLHTSSCHLTTFVVANERWFHYQCMLMGWSGASNIYNACMAATVDHLPNVHRIVEDILVALPNATKHVHNLHAMFQACQEHNIGLKKEKV